MLKTQAMSMLGGTLTSTAKAIGITKQAVCKWPEILTPVLEDRVIAALVRQNFSEKSGSATRKVKEPK
jgi:hypothetical protein